LHDDELAALTATPVILRSLLAEGRESRPAGDEDWTAAEVVAHLRDAEEFRLLRCRRMRDENEPFIAAFDQEQLARDRDYPSTDLAEALEAFERLRSRVLQLLAALDDRAWQRAGLHEENGRITIEAHIRHAISHDLVHLRQIAESLVTATG
jgi:DinB superfamily